MTDVTRSLVRARRENPSATAKELAAIVTKEGITASNGNKLSAMNVGRVLSGYDKLKASKKAKRVKTKRIARKVKATYKTQKKTLATADMLRVARTLSINDTLKNEVITELLGQL